MGGGEFMAEGSRCDSYSRRRAMTIARQVRRRSRAGKTDGLLDMKNAGGACD